jgi:hypothetical protein
MRIVGIPKVSRAMYIELDLTKSRPEPARLCEPRDFQHMNVTILGSADLVRASAALAPVGELVNSQTARLRVAAIRELAGSLGADEGWSAQFGAMLDYAFSRGWLDESREIVEAHCEWDCRSARYGLSPDFV